MGRKITLSLHDLKQIILAIDFMLFFSSELFEIADGQQIKADAALGFKVSPNASTSLVLEFNNYNEPRCYAHLIDEICTAVTYKKKERKCLKNLYGRVFLEPDSDSETWIKSMLPTISSHNLFNFNFFTFLKLIAPWIFFF